MASQEIVIRFRGLRIQQTTKAAA